MVSAPEATRDERIDIFIESTALRCVYELRTKHDFSHLFQEIGVGSRRACSLRSCNRWFVSDRCVRCATGWDDVGA